MRKVGSKQEWSERNWRNSRKRRSNNPGREINGRDESRRLDEEDGRYCHTEPRNSVKGKIRDRLIYSVNKKYSLRRVKGGVGVFSHRFDLEAKSDLLMEAVEDENLSRDIRRLELLLKDSRPIDQEALDSAIFAAVPNNCAALNLLLRDGRGNPFASGNRITRSRIGATNASMVQLLLADERADPIVNNCEDLAFACRFGDLEMVHALLEDPRVQRFIAGKELWSRFWFCLLNDTSNSVSLSVIHQQWKETKLDQP